MKYNINYSDLNNQFDASNNIVKYIRLDEKSVFSIYDKIILTMADKIKDKVITSKEEFVNNVNQFNSYLKDIASFIHKSNKKDSKKYIKNLMKLNNIESEILYSIFQFINSNFENIEENHMIRKKNLTGGGKLKEKICTMMILASDVAGMIPAAGVPIDAAGVVLSLLCGDFFGAFLGMVSIIPVAGWASGGMEILRGLIKLWTVFSWTDDEDEDEDEYEDEYDDD